MKSESYKKSDSEEKEDKAFAESQQLMLTIYNIIAAEDKYDANDFNDLVATTVNNDQIFFDLAEPFFKLLKESNCLNYVTLMAFKNNPELHLEAMPFFNFLKRLNCLDTKILIEFQNNPRLYLKAEPIFSSMLAANISLNGRDIASIVNTIDLLIPLENQYQAIWQISRALHICHQARILNQKNVWLIIPRIINLVHLNPDIKKCNIPHVLGLLHQSGLLNENALKETLDRFEENNPQKIEEMNQFVRMLMRSRIKAEHANTFSQSVLSKLFSQGPYVNAEMDVNEKKLSDGAEIQGHHHDFFKQTIEYAKDLEKKEHEKENKSAPAKNTASENNQTPPRKTR